MRRNLEEQTTLMTEKIRCATKDNSNTVTEDSLASLNHSKAITKAQSHVLTIAVAVIALGTMAWLYVKLST
ncbi:hypothetical protein YC2023_081712 [Brassica napus]